MAKLRIIQYTKEESHSLLPEGYTQLKYIGRSATGPYIDTGVKPSSNIKIEIQYRLSVMHDENMTIGVSTTSSYASGQNYVLDHYTSKFCIAYGSGSLTQSSQGASTNTVYTVTMDGNKLYLGDNLIATSSNTASFPDYNLFLFTRNVKGTPEDNSNYAFYGDVYYCKIWKGGTLLRYFVPGRRDSDSVLGMYDITNDVFYTNAGTGAFTAGGSATELVTKTSLIGKRSGTTPIIPSTYTQLQYIKCSGTQYINTGVYFKGDMEIIAKISSTNVSSNTAVFGCNNGTSWTAGEVALFYNSSKYDVPYPTSNSASTGLTGIGAVLANTAYTYKYNKTGFYVNNLSLRSFSNFYENYVCTRTLFIGATDRGSAVVPSPISIYSFKIKEDDDYIRKFIPAKRNSDSVLGLYDTVTDTFFTNAGTGTFTAGPEVTNSYYTGLRVIETEE